MSSSALHVAVPRSPTLLGHPAGLFNLFFVEMWERFSYYGMRAILVFYMLKGFLGFGDNEAYAVYGAYTALVYAAPFIGGMLADRLLGARRAVIIGGMLMAVGQFLLMIEDRTAFFSGLAILVCGNGFFKPNISTIVGGLYPSGSPRKDAGFTIFYMGINLGAAMSPVLCGYVGETFGWHWGFGLAGTGMLLGLAVFVAPTRLTQGLILFGALGTAIAMPFLQDSLLQLAVRLFLAVALVVAGIVAVIALGRGGIPDDAGAPRDPDAAKRKLGGILRADLAVYLGILIAAPLIALAVQRNEIAGYLLAVTTVCALAYIFYEAIFRSTTIERERIWVVLVLMFFSIMFWTFFEQAGSSLNNFTDRNVNRVIGSRTVTEADVGTTVEFRIPLKTDRPDIAAMPLLNQAQLGHVQGDKVFTLTDLTKLRDRAAKKGDSDADKVIAWKITQENVGMGIGGAEIPASEYQAVNPIYILFFGLLLSALWQSLGRRGLEPSTPIKFSMGLLLLGLGFVVLWQGAQTANSYGIVSMYWLLLAYLLHTVGELCLSPVGLAMITRLSPTRIVATTMGAWFLATAISQFIAGKIAALTGVSQEGAEELLIPPPVETVHVYGDVFGWIGVAAMIAAAILFVMSPLLNRWTHAEATGA
jgi:POT family proton-dependent oligopeptide transporter